MLPSCWVYNDNPLSDPKEAKADEKLYGKWVDKDKNVLTIDKVQAGNDTPGMMKFSGDNDVKFFCTTLNGKTYMNLPTVSTKLPPLRFFAYAVTDDKFTIFYPDLAVLINAINNGQLEGTAKDDENGVPKVFLKESTANLRKFFESKTGQEVFAGKEPALVFTRKKD